MQQGEVGADQVVVAADVHLRRSQLFITRQMYRRRTRRPRRFDQRRIAIHSDRRDGPISQCPQQPAFAAAQIKHALGLTAQHRQEDCLVSDLLATFDGAVADGFDPGVGIVLPTVQEGGLGGGHSDVRSCGEGMI
ncbi:hypothetical protein D3C76_1175180 [compost metagenome]